MELTDDPKREFDRACAIMESEIAAALKYLQRMMLLSGLIENGDFNRAKVNILLAECEAETALRQTGILKDVLEVISPSDREEGDD